MEKIRVVVGKKWSGWRLRQEWAGEQTAATIREWLRTQRKKGNVCWVETPDGREISDEGSELERVMKGALGA